MLELVPQSLQKNYIDSSTTMNPVCDPSEEVSHGITKGIQ